MSTNSDALEREEERLERLALTGEGTDFANFYEHHQAKVYNVTYRVAGNPDVAAEATQEAFSRIWAMREDLAARGVNLSAYVYRVARNLVLDHHRGRGREVVTDEIDVAAGADASFEADAEAGEMLVAQQSELRQANSRLPEKQRLVLALRELEGLSYEEIAEVMETTAGGVAQLLLRARIALRRELRLGLIDEDRLAGSCRALLPEIVALIDDQLPASRTEAVQEHLAGCGDCRSVKAACEEAGERYRAWLPLAGLGTEAAQAAPWLATATTAPIAVPASGFFGGDSRSRRRRNRAALVAAIGAMVIAVPLALPALTAGDKAPAVAEPEPAIGPCDWCERLDEATAAAAQEPEPEPDPVEPDPEPPAVLVPSPVPRVQPGLAPPSPTPVAPAPRPVPTPTPAPNPPAPVPPPADPEPPQVASETPEPEPPPTADPEPTPPEPAPQPEPEPPAPDPGDERPDPTEPPGPGPNDPGGQGTPPDGSNDPNDDPQTPPPPPPPPPQGPGDFTLPPPTGPGPAG